MMDEVSMEKVKPERAYGDLASPQVLSLVKVKRMVAQLFKAQTTLKGRRVSKGTLMMDEVSMEKVKPERAYEGLASHQILSLATVEVLKLLQPYSKTLEAEI